METQLNAQCTKKKKISMTKTCKQCIITQRSLITVKEKDTKTPEIFLEKIHKNI